MKQLSINRIAGAGFRQNHRQYRALMLGIFLSIFLMLATLQAADGVYAAMKEKTRNALGTMDAYLPDTTIDDKALIHSGLFKPNIGHVFVSASLNDQADYLGAYDAEAQTMLRRSVLEGRLPEKAGEIAMEETVANSQNAKVGHTITLSLLPIAGEREERSWTVVGILKNQSGLLAPKHYYSVDIDRFPSLIVSNQEPPFRTGRIAVHKLVSYRPGIIHAFALKYMDNRMHALMFGIGANGEILAFHSYIDEGTTQLLAYVILIGGALMISAGVGISGAMSSMLTKRTQEIAMLRAVGATRRQIRRIFGREAWLIALIATPAALLLSYTVFFLIGRFFPKQFLFRPNPFVLAAAAAFSALVILLSAFFPLLRASRTYPMGVLRDTVLLRRMQKRKSRMVFSIPRLIAVRQLLGHPTRAIGLSLLISLMLVLTSFLINGLLYVQKNTDHETPAFYIFRDSVTHYENWVEKTTPSRTLTENDIAQIRSLPLVKNVHLTALSNATLMIDRETAYVRPFDLDAIQKAGYPVTESDRMRQRYSLSSVTEDTDKRLTAFRSAFQVQGKPLECQIEIISDLSSMELISGTVNQSAIDSGKEVLLAAPDIYLYSELINGEDRILIETSSKPKKPLAVKTNQEQFLKGQTLQLIRITKEENQTSRNHSIGLRDIDLNQEYSNCSVQKASPRIGGLLKEKDYGMLTVVTTEKGWKALGFPLNGSLFLNIYLKRTPSPEEEKLLVQSLESIAARCEKTQVDNRLKSNRDFQAGQRQTLLVLSAVCLLLFCVSVSMATGQATRHIAAEQRLIGTLRAVGADQRVIFRCYLSQMLLNLGVGALCGLLLSAFLLIYTIGPNHRIAQVLPFTLIYALLLCLCCVTMLRLRIRGTMNKSVVENIREL